MGVDVHHIERNPGCQAEALALADREAVHAVVTAEQVSLLVANHSPRHLGVPADEVRVLARGDEADFLAVLLFGDLQAEPPRLFTDRGLVERADGETGPRQLRLSQAEK